jgi:hypothetical protein
MDPVHDAARVDLLGQHADAGGCDLVARTTLFDTEAGSVYVGNGRFRADRRAAAPIGESALRLLARTGRPVTFTCVPPGSGERISVDRDAHTDPGNPTSRPRPDKRGGDAIGVCRRNPLGNTRPPPCEAAYAADSSLRAPQQGLVVGIAGNGESRRR